MPVENKPKALYIAESLEQLNEKGECNIKNITSIKGLCSTAERAYREADKASKDNDQERAYVLFMKYMNMCTGIKKRKEYLKDKKYFDSLLGVINFKKALEEAEKLQESLTKRYIDRKEENEIKERFANEEKEKKEETRSDETDNMKKTKEDTPATDVCSDIVGANGRLSSFDLYTLIQDHKKSIIVMDVRSSDDYQESRVKDDNCVINVPNSAVKPGCTVAVIEKGLPSESRELWSRRQSMDYIILLDWDKSSGGTINALKDALFKWDSSVTLKHEPLILQGGYDDWLLRYPMFTTNSKVIPPVFNQNSSLKTTADLLNFDFPTLEDDEPKPEPMINGQIHINGNVNGHNTVAQKLVPDQGKSTPLIDRSSKPKPMNQSNVITNEPPKPVGQNGQSKPSQPVVSSNAVIPNIVAPPVITGAGDVPNTAVTTLPKQEFETSEEIKTSLPQINRALKPSLGTTELKDDVNTKSESAVVVTDIQPPELGETVESKSEVSEVEDQMQSQESKLKSHKDKELQARMDLDKLRASKMRAENYEQKKKLEDKEEQMNKMVKQMEMERIEMEKERKLLEEKSKALDQERKMLKANEKRIMEELSAKERKLVGEQLPPNWERKLDTKSNKYFYIDHNTKKTYWNPPPNMKPVNSTSIPQSVIQSGIPSQQKPTTIKPIQDQPTPTRPPVQDKPPSSRTALQDKPTSTKVPLQDQPKPKLTRSMSSPNIAQMVLNEGEGKPAPLPTFDRRMKPLPATSSSTKAVKSSRNLGATYGGMGPGLTGLRNLGNTCFMNSVVQCLSNTKYLTDYFVYNNYQRDINRENALGRKGEVAEEYAVVVRALWCGQYKAISPRDLSNTVIKYVPEFNKNIGHHHDSQEFLIFLMDGLHEDLNRVRKREYIEEKDNKLPDIEAASLAWNNYKRLNQSICVELFQGQYKSTVQCETCKNTMVKFDTFMYVSLPLPSSSKCSLKDCLEHFSKPEKLSGDNAVKCTKCKVKRNSIKTIRIWRTPPVLIIHLKRFYFEGRWRQKLQTNVDFPLTGLDLNPFTVGPRGKAEYFLYGVSSHTGGLDGGHYTAMCKNPTNNKWYKYDDHEVYDISASRAKQGSAAYILFYSSKKW